LHNEVLEQQKGYGAMSSLGTMALVVINLSLLINQIARKVELD
jgi:hypothetical protein